MTPLAFRSRVSSLALALVAVAALAAEEGHDAHAGGHETLQAIPTVEQGVITGVTAVVVFLLVLTILSLKVWPTISKALDARNHKIKSEIEAAEMARKQARAALDDYEKSLAQARAEAQRMLDDTRAQQNKLAAELKARNEAELGQMRERAMKDIEGAKRAALNEIYADAASLATQVASKILGREVSAGDQQRLVEESLRELKSVQTN
ncbi:MAG: F0F1 ATP synthase subunit B [Phycisphaerales bacterium]|nr:F0F1 ATP synthase subunit B [Phycisphaerales bacterium]